MPSDTHSGLHTWAQIVWMTTLKNKIKRTPYGFHQHCSTSLDTYLAFSLQRPFVERAYFSAGVDICRENESLHMLTAQRAPAHCATDEWGTRPLIYLNLQQHSWLKWSRSPANGGIQCRTAPWSPDVESLDQRRGSVDIVGWNSFKHFKRTTRITTRVKSQISGTIWSGRGMRTENTRLKATSTILHQNPESRPEIIWLRALLHIGRIPRFFRQQRNHHFLTSIAQKCRWETPEKMLRQW